MKDEIKEILFLLHNDRLTESGKRKLEDYITNLQEENKKLLKKSYSDDVKITKAIEYIKNELYILGIRDNRKQQDELLNILQGEDKE